MIDPMQYAGLTPQPPQLNFAPMNLNGQPRQNNQNQMTQAILQAALRGGSPGQNQQAQVGQTMPGGAMNIVPPMNQGGLAGMLGGLFRQMSPTGATPSAPPSPMQSSEALY